MKHLTFSISFLLFLACACKNSGSNQEQDTITSIPICAPITTDKAWYLSDNKAPLFEGLGDLHFPISTDDDLAQKYFDQGLTLAYGFNHAEAARSFYYASKLDPECAMTYWGFAYVLGPNYNAGMEPDNYERAYKAIQRALELSEDNTTDKERDMILALAKRYVNEPVEDRYHLDVEYSAAMKDLYLRYPDDADIGTLYVESVMNLHPWDLYDENGVAKEWTPSIVEALEHILDQNPAHCGAHHFYIHAVEASSSPDRGMESARILDEGLVPEAGHLVHMPSHIYIRTGDYHKGTLANIAAIHVDTAYVTACNAQGVYPLAYFPHNQHFMAATATLEGNSYWALYAADEVSKNANRQLMKEPGWGTLQHYYSIPFYVYTKFGKWKEILEMENEVPSLKYPSAILHYARGMALLGLDDLEGAKNEWESLKGISEDASLKEITIWDINTVFDLVQIAEKVLHAEILAREDKYGESISILKDAVEIEDNLNYNEPPDWFFSVRHNLGAIQLEAELYNDAVVTYEEDLKQLPINGWALKGLTLAYSGLNSLEKMQQSETRFKNSWSTADVALESSVIR